MHTSCLNEFYVCSYSLRAQFVCVCQLLEVVKLFAGALSQLHWVMGFTPGKAANLIELCIVECSTHNYNYNYHTL